MIKVIELFAGVGGFRLGLESVGGFEVVWANQWEPSKKAQDAFECYVRQFKNKGTHSNEDIATVDEKSLVSFNANLLVGGFPCQDYSVARSLSGEKGIEGKKGILFWEIVRILKELRPRYVLLENVDRLIKSPAKQRGRDFSVMLASLRDLNYSVEWRIINAADYGFAQRRRRIFIFAVQNDTSFVAKMNKIDNVTILHHKGFFAKPFPVEECTNEKHKPLSFTLPCDILEISNKFSAKFLNSGIMKNGNVYTEELIPIKESPITLGEILQTNVGEKYYLDKKTIEKFQYLKGPKKIERTSSTGHKYIFSEGGMAFPDSLDMPGRTMLTSEGTVNRSSHVIEDPVTKKLRILTPVECERLNGFPDNWTEGMPERMRYFCMGNALVVGLIKKMGERIKEIESEETTKAEERIIQLSLF
ncbi:DNA (cytosine-5)-methyltransferase 1 [Anoxybacillus voinovskiensis]|uniref:Cytosine-specific methyltransferase n=1 Tax=Anoxybacteroides voinovskiense TaxID=230470 RepID=A0A840DY58_9BACL|nr:DNA (cytosine-5-)-methyltransferase [Anoxybacillus voinovskiensis]MBB4074459.1 DNA (cytosine-5)-methyltransferase 1 [Anoxybacillus voinovskiensis]GGJ79295.1 cytosine-specific methyltransferase [Anoxybacillus voinovskiensis]